ncbi:MAG: bifunctional 4-hydroxy-2-oxoglutarate aldolase/2-dehydro-3-deoxy-phosphogluconate aldolase [Geminocystis sp.]|nr:bifunctional 4-hydroxy-2-oxoglutarate aldolase/2-dehydro-3-deoxy-phosphogluconate aldolase [Geminocystis sp.]HIK37532.1 bifunctional 4-hydroxy-2-oxoglutarate aldolase/2-dehydro-3-deoxy-phosphogluconate aldolase [Geminocystis sp. M7585_C2015_104]MCS7146686.1 bifunctional 4-hydroxy-2-oxoglutarate aldolase/2-dehydro-3-deoxy-phosphogluconate aldolase [Geminocystis sp.]MCX8077164.1 bifunctional 4-hydroxy-2-oxoglutarate aldolase/2-dehydro-3-deoxy-phosphogluconate aldolase [Geminocystis sp.]MDW8115
MLQQWLTLLKTSRIIAVIRAGDWQEGKKKAQAVAQAGVKLIEVTWNSDQPLKLIEYLRTEFPSCRVGVGTILDKQSLREAIQGGVQFAFSPHFSPELLEIAHSHNIPLTPGALSPTEILTAFQYGARTVKVFPISALGGVEYLKSILAPLPHLPLIPTGGVTLANAADYIKAGAIAVGLAGDLFPSFLVKQGNWQEISQRARRLQQQLFNYIPPPIG